MWDLSQSVWSSGLKEARGSSLVNLVPMLELKKKKKKKTMGSKHKHSGGWGGGVIEIANE